MTALSKYWMLVSINPGGGYRKREVARVKTFLQQQFAPMLDLADGQLNELTEAGLQQQLFAYYQAASQADAPRQSFLAELALRCFISHQILQTCMQLASQFGQAYGIQYHDLLPYVLNDVLSTGMAIGSLAEDILKTFEPQRGNLTAWTIRKVKHHRALNDFLLEHGIYQISDWAILNDTKPRQLERILVDFHTLAAVEVQQWVALLQAYHQVYRLDRLQQRSLRRNQPCLAPSEDQLHRISQLLPNPPQPSHRLLRRLQDLAELIRAHRIYVRGGRRQQVSLDQPQHSLLLESLAAPQPSQAEVEETEFLTVFRQEFMATLDQAIAHVMQARLNQLQVKDPQAAVKFLTALKLFHCRGQSMGAIAPQIGLQQQYQVSRLLALKQLRDAVRRQMIVTLRDTCLNQIGVGLNPERLHALDTALDELITDVLSEAEAEVSHAKGRPLRSRFAHSLCQYLC